MGDEFILGLLGIAFVILLASRFITAESNNQRSGVPTSLADLPRFVSGLQSSANSHAFLIINLPETGDFVQLLGDEHSILASMPLITQRQIQLEERLRSFAAEQGLQLAEMSQRDGSRDLGVELQGTVEYVCPVIVQLCQDVFGVSPGRKVEYNWDGYDPLTA